MAKEIKYIFRDENSELNTPLKNLLINLEEHYFGIEDYLGDPERLDPEDLLNHFDECCEYLKLNTIKDTIFPIIEELKGILYSGCEYVDLRENEVRKIQPYMRGFKAQRWLGKEVKPLILSGVTRQNEISQRVGVGSSTINNRVSNAYGVNWYDYVKGVQEGIY